MGGGEVSKHGESHCMWELWETRRGIRGNTGLLRVRESKYMCAFRPSHVHMRVHTHRESEIQGGSRDERKHEIYEGHKKRVCWTLRGKH